MTGQLIDTGYQEAMRVLPYQASHIALVLVGLGGTGSFLARHVACLATLLEAVGKVVSVTFIDPDRVERANIPRQNFCEAELGRNKAEALADRYRDAFGIEIGVIASWFVPAMVTTRWDTLTVLIGCVDSASGRRDMGSVLAQNDHYRMPPGMPRVWYLDLGNGRDVGQVLLGSAGVVSALAPAFRLAAIPGCSLLPSPLLQQPGLAEPEHTEGPGRGRSCAQLLAAHAQSLLINPMMADVGAGYLYELLVAGSLRRFATFIDVAAGTMRSRYTTPAQVAAAIGQSVAFFDPPPEDADQHTRY